MLLTKDHKSINTIMSISSLLFLLILVGCGGGSSNSSSPAATKAVDGQGGSMARFSIIGDFLYTISGPNLQWFNLANNPALPTIFANKTVGWDIETLYSSNQYLFVGASDGVYIFDNSDPSNPVEVSKFLHVRSCDPVIVNQTYAYVTLRSGARCGRGSNKMEVLDISDITKPRLVKSYAMQNPKGLGVQDGLLFVCDGKAGLKVYDVNTNPANPKFVTADTAINCYDLIPFKKNQLASNVNNDNITINGNLVISDNSGVLQYQYDNVGGLTKLSELLTNKIKVAK